MKYQEMKERVRQMAIDWQLNDANNNASYQVIWSLQKLEIFSISWESVLDFLQSSERTAFHVKNVNINSY